MTLPVFAGVRVLGVDEHVWHHQGRRRRGPRELTGIVDHSRGGSSHGPLEWTWSRVGLAPCMRTGYKSAAKTSVRGCESRRWNPSRDRRNASVRPSRQMRRISVSTSPTTAPSKCARSSTKPHPPTADAWPLVSSSAYQPVPSPKSLAWAGPYASGRTHSTPTSIPTEPATAPRKPSTDIIELGRRTARGYRNPTSYQLRMLLIAGGLDASTHTQL